MFTFLKRLKLHSVTNEIVCFIRFQALLIPQSLCMIHIALDFFP